MGSTKSKGTYNQITGLIKWSNGTKWKKQCKKSEKKKKMKYGENLKANIGENKSNQKQIEKKKINAECAK